MDICIIGAGAIGGLVGAGLTQAGENVTYLVRGHHLAHLKKKGMRVLGADGRERLHVPAPAVEHLSALGKQDVVLLAVKAHQIAAIAADLHHVIGPDTIVVPMQNGLPWWYFQRHGGALEGLRLERVDPGGVIAAAIAPERVVGSIAYFSTEIVEPGVIRHIEGNRLSLGEPDGTRSERARRLAEALIPGGLRCPISTRFRHEIWVKLLGNVAFNPASALTRATLVEMARHPEVSALVRAIMGEVEAVASRLGLELPISIDQRMAGAEKVGAHKTSMLQDLEAGRPMELDPVVGAVVELGERLGVTMPSTRAVYACAKLLEAGRRGPGSEPRRG